MEIPRWKHRFENGLTLGSIVYYRGTGSLVPCGVIYEMLMGQPHRLRLLPLNIKDNINRKSAGTPLLISEEDLLNTDIVIPYNHEPNNQS